VAKTCNPSYSGGRGQGWGDHVRVQLKKKNSRDFISTNGWAQWYLPIIPATWRSTNRRIAVQNSLSKKVRPYLKNDQSKKGE
jgi:hypothetical protein